MPRIRYWATASVGSAWRYTLKNAGDYTNHPGCETSPAAECQSPRTGAVSADQTRQTALRWNGRPGGAPTHYLERDPNGLAAYSLERPRPGARHLCNSTQPSQATTEAATHPAPSHQTGDA